jgi:hypothetical protein
MERVKKGERYWFISDRFEVCFSIEDNSPISDKHFETNNYFHTREEAEACARKLHAVLKGADVIEMPSEEEIEISAIDAAEAYRKYIVKFMIPTFQRAYEDGYKKGVFEIKSKIIK